MIPVRENSEVVINYPDISLDNFLGRIFRDIRPFSMALYGADPVPLIPQHGRVVILRVHFRSK